MATRTRFSWKKRIGLIGVGYTVSFLLTQMFKFGIYPAVIWHLGLVKGAGVMWTLSFIICYTAITFYNFAKFDWFGIEALKDIRESKAREEGYFRRILRRILVRGGVVAFIALSMKFDAFVCTVYMRDAHHYGGMTKRDWVIFLVALVISNITRTTIVFLALTAGEWIIAD
jgi:hypothetical protein